MLDDYEVGNSVMTLLVRSGWSKRVKVATRSLCRREICSSERGHARVQERGLNSYISPLLDKAERAVFVPTRTKTVYSTSSAGNERAEPKAQKGGGSRKPSSKGDRETGQEGKEGN